MSWIVQINRKIQCHHLGCASSWNYPLCELPCIDPTVSVEITHCFSYPFFDLGDIFVVVSPVVSPHAYGNVIAVCAHRGFVLQGVRQLLLSREQAVVLGMTTSQVLGSTSSGGCSETNYAVSCWMVSQHSSSKCSQGHSFSLY